MSRPSACRRLPARNSCMSIVRATGSTAARRVRLAGLSPPRWASGRPIRTGRLWRYLHVMVNTSYLGLIRQAQRGFQMDFEVSRAFENINAEPEGDAVPGYGV